VFGIGGSEILVILVIALLFLGPDKLPEAAKTISKTVRDLKKQGRILQQTIENDEHIGGAIRDLKSALRGDEIVTRPAPKKLPQNTIAKPEDLAKVDAAEAKETTEAVIAEANVEAKTETAAKDGDLVSTKPDLPTMTLPPTAGDIDPDARALDHHDDHEELAKLVKPAAGVVARDDNADAKHG
jgi:sec-independent protein translocase protein TatB